MASKPSGSEQHRLNCSDLWVRSSGWAALVCSSVACAVDGSLRWLHSAVARLGRKALESLVTRCTSTGRSHEVAWWPFHWAAGFSRECPKQWRQKRLGLPKLHRLTSPARGGHVSPSASSDSMVEKWAALPDRRGPSRIAQVYVRRAFLPELCWDHSVPLDFMFLP